MKNMIFIVTIFFSFFHITFAQSNTKPKLEITGSADIAKLVEINEGWKSISSSKFKIGGSLGARFLIPIKSKDKGSRNMILEASYSYYTGENFSGFISSGGSITSRYNFERHTLSANIYPFYINYSVFEAGLGIWLKYVIAERVDGARNTSGNAGDNSSALSTSDFDNLSIGTNAIISVRFPNNQRLFYSSSLGLTSETGIDESPLLAHKIGFSILIIKLEKQ